MNAILVFILRLILIVLAYLFIGWMGYTIFMDLKQERYPKKQEEVPAITVMEAAGQQGQEKQFSMGEIIIGRDPTCNFPLEDETISLRHCRLFFERKQWWVEDLDSTNGSYLNDERLETSTVLTNNDELRLGQVTLTITINS